MQNYKALIFDLGKVVFDLSFDLVFQSWALSSGRSFENIKEHFLFNDTFAQMERGAITEADFRKTVSQELNLNITDTAFDSGWCDLYLDVYPGMEALLVQLKHKYRLVALTNTNSIHYNVWPVKYATVLTHFEKIFSSHELGTRKPEAEAYQLVLDYLQCQPGEVLFLDDNPENIEGAVRLGISALQVQSQEQLLSDLRATGILA